MLREGGGGLRIATSVLKGGGGNVCICSFFPHSVLFLSAFAERSYARFKRALMPSVFPKYHLR